MPFARFQAFFVHSSTGCYHSTQITVLLPRPEQLLGLCSCCCPAPEAVPDLHSQRAAKTLPSFAVDARELVKESLGSVKMGGDNGMTTRLATHLKRAQLTATHNRPALFCG